MLVVTSTPTDRVFCEQVYLSLIDYAQSPRVICLVSCGGQLAHSGSDFQKQNGMPIHSIKITHVNPTRSQSASGSPGGRLFSC